MHRMPWKISAVKDTLLTTPLDDLLIKLADFCQPYGAAGESMAKAIIFEPLLKYGTKWVKEFSIEILEVTDNNL